MPHLETDSWNISDSVASPTKSSDQNLILQTYIKKYQETWSATPTRMYFTWSSKLQLRKTYIFLDVVEATVVWHKSSNLLAVLDQLDPRTLPDS